MYEKTKRIFDIVFSGTCLIVLFPFLLLIGCGIKLSSKGKILYFQRRLGHKGKIFNCLKFRTMHEDAEERLEELLRKDHQLKQEWIENQKLKKDPRVFFFGSLLRKCSLDELPQFWNVIKGDLSLVGPRPYMVCQKKDIGYSINKILSVKPGMTGLWQTSGRSKTSFEQRIFLDAQYVDNCSFWYDLVLIGKTIPIVIFAKDAC